MIKAHKAAVGKVHEAGSSPKRKTTSTHPPVKAKNNATSKEGGDAIKSKTSTKAANKNTKAKGMKQVRKADY